MLLPLILGLEKKKDICNGENQVVGFSNKFDFPLLKLFQFI